MKKIFTLVIIAFLINGCAKDVDAPSWLKIEPWQLNSNPNADYIQGEMTHAITEAWVNMDGKVLGIFELPVKIPVIGEGEHNFILVPGVIQNGISSTKVQYPFLKQYATTMTISTTDTATMYPETMYHDAVQFWIEDFENAAVKIETDPTSNATLEVGNDSEHLEWGNFYGHVALNNTDSLWLGYSNEQMSLPLAESYLELDFKNTNSLLTSVLDIESGAVSSNPNVILQPQSNPVWKKIYISLTAIRSNNPNASSFEQAFTAVLDEIGTNKDIYLDNIKVIHF